MDVPFALVEAVRPAVTRHARRTPLVESEWLSGASGKRIFLKCENLQVTGSFKARGALAALSAPGADAARGVFTVSTGNHGQGLAFAASRLGVRCTVVVPRLAPANKLEKVRARGAEVVVAPFDGFDDAQAWALEDGRFEARFVSAYEDAHVAAGNGGTTMLEVLEAWEELAPGLGGAPDAIVVPTGGGGLAVGVGVVARERAPSTRVVAVNPEASPGLWLSRRDGRAHTHLASDPTIADGVEGGVGAENYRIAETCVDDVVMVSEPALEAAVRETALREKLVIEGSAALSVAALLDGAVEGERVVLLLTGGNIDPSLLARLLA